MTKSHMCWRAYTPNSQEDGYKLEVSLVNKSEFEASLDCECHSAATNQGK